MKKYLLTIAVMAMGFAACTDTIDNSAPVVDDKEWKAEAYKDYSVKPGDDFFMYCNGGYWNSTTLSGIENIKSVFINGMSDEMKKREDALTIASKVKLLADVNKTDAETINLQKQKLQNAIDRVNAITTKEEAWTLVAQLMKEGYCIPLDFYLFNNEGETCVVLLGPSKNEYNPNTKKEESLWWKLTNDPNIMANLRPLKNARTRGFDNEKYPMLVTIFNELGISLEKVYLPDACSVEIFYKLADKDLKDTQMLQNYSVEEWKKFLLEALDQDRIFFDDEYLKAVNSAENRSLTHRDAVTNFANKYLRYEISYEFAKAYITDELKQQMTAHTEELRQTFRERIMNNEWMSEASKQNAIEKLDAMKFNIGSPDEWFEEGLADISNEPTLLDDVLALRRANLNLKFKLVTMPKDRVAFHIAIINHMPLTTVNAMYHPNFNEIFIMPAFMMTPAYDPLQNDAHNYATMMIWGHEITHGFDTNGAQWNKIGDLGDIWASDADRQEFEKRSKQLMDYYSSFDIMPFETGLKNDGVYTVSENVADLGGFLLAYDSYVKHLKKLGFKGEQLRLQQQRFYEAYTYIWCGKWNETYAKDRTLGSDDGKTKKDVHSLWRERTNGVVTNTDDWYDFYDITPTDKLYLAPKDRIRIW